MTWFCLECAAEVPPHATRCPACGAPADAERSYEEKLLAALSHRLPNRRLLAAEILGRVRSRAAIPRLAELALDASDPYLQAVAARSLGRIEPDHPVVRHLAVRGPVLTRAALRGDRR
jgi:HEAT repeat protein